jgi:hypothetical protein
VSTHLPLIITPGKDLFLPTALHFLKCILIIQRGFALVFQACIYHTLIKLIPSPFYLHILYHNVSLILKNLQYTTLYYIYISVGCFNIFISQHLFTSSASHSPLKLTNTILFSLSICKCMCIYIYVCLHDHMFLYI